MSEQETATSLTVRTGARLHFGLLSFGQSSGRQFGGLGAMIDRPGFELTATPARRDEIIAPAEWSERIAGTLRRCRESVRTAAGTRLLRLELSHFPPAHAGFGSGTQLGLAVARVVAHFSSESLISATELARRAGRGQRSAIGVHGFDFGGLLLEAGKTANQQISPLVSRAPLPESWRFVLIRPRNSQGVFGPQEANAFRALPTMEESTTNQLCGLAVRELIPAVLEGDFDRFAAGLWEYGTVVGNVFSPVQGGVFANPQMARLARRLNSTGFPGVAQTSWGPTICAACTCKEEAEWLTSRLLEEPDASNCEILTASGLNSGASSTIGDS